MALINRLPTDARATATLSQGDTREYLTGSPSSSLSYGSLIAIYVQTVPENYRTRFSPYTCKT